MHDFSDSCGRCRYELTEFGQGSGPWCRQRSNHRSEACYQSFACCPIDQRATPLQADGQVGNRAVCLPTYDRVRKSLSILDNAFLAELLDEAGYGLSDVELVRVRVGSLGLSQSQNLLASLSEVCLQIVNG